MENSSFERAIVWHCAPTLAGIKPASLLSLSTRQFPDLPEITGWYDRMLRKRGLRFLPLCRCRRGALLLVYRADRLDRALRDPRARKMLRETGYPVEQGLDALLRHLTLRLEQADGFPHEVGLFLGYPPEDVEGFLSDVDGTGCKLCGVWKVYHDVEGARQTFARYRTCRDTLWARLEEGTTLRQLFSVEGQSRIA